MSLAFFDLDRTLLSVNGAELWVRREVRDGWVSRWQAARASLWIASYHLGFVHLERALETAIATLEGQREDEVAARTARFYAEELAGAYRRRTRAVLERHVAAGDTLVMLTSSSVYLARDASRDLGIPHVLCNRFEVRDGLFTGRPDGPLCYGRGKLVHARAFAEARGERLEDAWFYTDSMSDLPVLEAVGRPVVVHPDRRLAAVARARGWPVERWDDDGVAQKR